jgi:hypothetical protein
MLWGLDNKASALNKYGTDSERCSFVALHATLVMRSLPANGRGLYGTVAANSHSESTEDIDAARPA